MTGASQEEGGTGSDRGSENSMVNELESSKALILYRIKDRKAPRSGNAAGSRRIRMNANKDSVNERPDATACKSGVMFFFAFGCLKAERLPREEVLRRGGGLHRIDSGFVQVVVGSG